MTGFTEDELLATIRRLLSGEAPGVRVGPGDDAAVVDMGWQSAVLTADMLVEGVHFDRSTISARDLGYKAVVVNVSDVAAMGGSPRYGLISLGLPPDADPERITRRYRALAGVFHPDRPDGDHERMVEITTPYAPIEWWWRWP